MIARRLRSDGVTVDPVRAMRYLTNLRSLWETDLPGSDEHRPVRREYELRRAAATAAGFDRLEVLGPLIVEARLADDPATGRPLALALDAAGAQLSGERAEVLRRLAQGKPSRLDYADTPEAQKKRRQRREKGTLSCIGRGERI